MVLEAVKLILITEDKIKAMKYFLVTLSLITVRLFPAFYYLTLLLSGAAVVISEALFEVYAIPFRPFIYAVLMCALLQAFNHKWFSLFNKYFWYWVRGNKPYQIIYLWLSLIVGVFGIACFASGLATVFVGADSQFSMFNIRDDIFFTAVAAFLMSPIFITLHLHLKGGKGFSNKAKQNAV